MIRRHELTDAEWEFVRPLLPRAESGRKRLDDRGPERDCVEVPDRFRLAGCARAVRVLGHPAHAVPSVGGGRHLRADAACTQYTAVMEAIRVPRLGPGRPRTKPTHVISDKGYSSKAIRTWLRARGIAHTIPERSDHIRNRLRRGSHGGRPPAFDKAVYKRRNVVER